MAEETDGTTQNHGAATERTGGRERRRSFRWTGFSLIAAGLTVFAVTTAIPPSGFVYNRTDSIPTGLYRKQEREARIGDYITLKPPVNDFTAKRPWIKGLIKNLVAAEGNRVRIDENGIQVDGVTLAKSKPQNVSGLQPANVDKTLGADEIVVASDYNIFSYDSRYFGILKKSDIKDVIEPFWTWGTPDETINKKSEEKQ